MQCPSCRAVYSNGLDLCPRCKTPAAKAVPDPQLKSTRPQTETLAKMAGNSGRREAASNPAPEASASGTSQTQAASTLLEFPGMAHRPQWRKELSERVREIQERRARESVRRWREYRPPVDLYVAPVLGTELPPVDCDELEVRIPASAFLRPFNVLGWAGLAIGDLQFVAPRDETVLAAGLAWENAIPTE